MRKVLIANRGEIAVRVIRACRDAGLGSVAVYADSDRDALHATLADEAYALGGDSATDTYLRIDKLVDVARKARADAVHPGYGFLAENAEFAQAVLDAGLTWIGPTPQAIRDLGDKVTARHIAERAGAPLVPGTAEPVKDADEIVAFAAGHGLPVAIKAAFGGGGRGLKVARTAEEIPALFESATREAVAAFGRGECFVERYLDQPRHVEAQVLADTHGNVIEVSTRLQVEHPVTEETAGVDLVREQFRIADGEPLRHTEDPTPRGHAIEFRINGEDPGRGFLPAPGTVTALRLPTGPGVRVDTGVSAGDVIGGNFDSLLAKVIVTGETRTEAIERARRALDEMVVEGMATALPFHRLIVRDEAFTADPFRIHTRWIETEWSDAVPAWAGPAVEQGGPEERTTV